MPSPVNLLPPLAAAAVLLSRTVSAAVFQSDSSLSSPLPIGDPPSSGVALTLEVSTPATSVDSLGVLLSINSAASDQAWNGDLYVQLTSPSGTVVVLVDRPGLSLADPHAGYGDAGMVLDINDASANDIHAYQTVAYLLDPNGWLTGSWQSDGRVDPTSGSRPLRLSTLYGENPNGTWTLLVSDMSSGNLATISSWSIYGSAVPEPVSSSLVGVALLAGAWWCRRRRTA